MPRRMSCSMTIAAVRDRTKTVTRRHVDTWTTLRPGDRLTLIEKGMGLAKGATQVVLAEVEIVDVSVEPITLLCTHGDYAHREMALEGFPGRNPEVWAAWWCQSHGYRVSDSISSMRGVTCRRIEWRYLDDAGGES